MLPRPHNKAVHILAMALNRLDVFASGFAQLGHRLRRDLDQQVQQ